MERQLKLQKTENDIEIHTYGFPNYEALTKADKRAMLLPLVETIREFYKDPENRRKCDEWKAEYAKQNPIAV